MKTATNKAQAKYFKEEEIRFEYSPELMNNIYTFLIDIGAKNEIPKDRKGYLIRLHENITLNNPLFPMTEEFEEIYPEWMMAVIRGEAERYGNNISTLVQCFNKWYKTHENTKGEYKPDIQEHEWDEICRNTRLEKWADEILVDQHKKYVKIFEGSEVELVGLRKLTKGYFGRIEKELHKRGLI